MGMSFSRSYGFLKFWFGVRWTYYGVVSCQRNIVGLVSWSRDWFCTTLFKLFLQRCSLRTSSLHHPNIGPQPPSPPIHTAPLKSSWVVSCCRVFNYLGMLLRLSSVASALINSTVANSFARFIFSIAKQIVSVVLCGALEIWVPEGRDPWRTHCPLACIAPRRHSWWNPQSNTLCVSFRFLVLRTY